MVFSALKTLKRTDLRWILRSVYVMSLCLTVGTVLRFIELRIDGFATWPYVLFAGGLFWLYSSKKITAGFNASDKLLLSLSYGICGLFIGTIPNLFTVSVLGYYYALVLPVLVPIAHKMDSKFIGRRVGITPP